MFNIGGNGNDSIIGGAGNDVFFGGDDDDTLIGGNGDDILFGDNEDDTLTGSSGSDAFSYNIRDSGPQPGTDLITDFTLGEDAIFIDEVVGLFGLESGELKPEQFVAGTSSNDSDDRFIYDQSLGNLFFDQDGTGSSAQVQLATLSSAPSIDSSEIFITSESVTSIDPAVNSFDTII